MADGKCSVEGCGREGVHKLSYIEGRILEKQGLKLNPIDAAPPRRPGYIYLCEEHYKLWKKMSKRDHLIRNLSRKEF